MLKPYHLDSPVLEGYVLMGNLQRAQWIMFHCPVHKRWGYLSIDHNDTEIDWDWHEGQSISNPNVSRGEMADLAYKDKAWIKVLEVNTQTGEITLCSPNSSSS